MDSINPKISRNVDFKEKLSDLRKEREESIRRTVEVVSKSSFEISKTIKQFNDLHMQLCQRQRSNLSLIIYWKKVGPNRVFPKGPYLQVKHRRIASKNWDAYHLGALIDFKPKVLKEKLPEVAYLELNPQTVDELCSAISLLKIIIAIKPDVERLIKELNIYLIPDKYSDANIKLMHDVEYILNSASKYLEYILRRLIELENKLDIEVRSFNSIMKKRYKSLFFKWDIHPPKKKRTLGHGHVRPYIITSLTFHKQFSITVESYKKKKHGSDSVVTPWITNRICLDARASQLKKAILNRQKKIIDLSEKWDIYYHQMLAIHTFILNIYNEVKQ